ncbi:MAG: hypothetical protein MZV65_14935 [Chromatiales bacterium]|nr:hypothetical protein [Chromatiales bacterium]
MAVTAFNEQAKTELTEYLERKAGQITARTAEEQRAAMQEAARLVFQSEATDRVAALANMLARASEAKPRPWVRLMEMGAASVLSGLTVGLVACCTGKRIDALRLSSPVLHRSRANNDKTGRSIRNHHPLGMAGL